MFHQNFWRRNRRNSEDLRQSWRECGRPVCTRAYWVKLVEKGTGQNTDKDCLTDREQIS